MKKLIFFALAFGLVLGVAATAIAQPIRSDEGGTSAPAVTVVHNKGVRYTEVAGPYRGFTYYSELGAVLTDLTNRSHGRIQMAYAGDSAGGHPLWRLTVTWPMSKKAWTLNNQYRALLLTNPTAAKKMLTNHFKVPGMGKRVLGSKVIKPVAMINASIHGGETTGVDATLQLVRRLALKGDATTVRWLKNTIIVIDPCQNPDGRIVGTRGNANGFDMNRDFITLTQPEDVITAATERMWLPNTMIDLHTSHAPTLIEPTTIPHNPNMEWDIQYSVEIPLGIAMGEAIHTQTGMDYTIPYFWGTAADRTNSTNEGWDDYGPYYTPQLAQEYGSAAFTHESNYTSTWDGVMIHYTSIKTLVDWTSQRGKLLLNKQCDWAKRGFTGSTTGRPWQGNMTDMVRASVFNPITNSAPTAIVSYGQAGFPYINAIGNIQFPKAYIVPVDATNQQNVLAAYKAINHALWYGITVLKAKAAFVVRTTTYPAGTFIVPMNQTLRGLANNLFWDGEDVKAKYGVSSMYDISAWSLKYAYGITANAVTTSFTMPKTNKVKNPDPTTPVYNADVATDGPLMADAVPTTVRKLGSVPSGPVVYWWAGNNVWAVRVANEALKFGFNVGMVTRQIAAPFNTVPMGAFVIDVSTTPWAMGLLNQYAAQWGIDFVGADGLQIAQTSKLAMPNIGYNSDVNTAFVLSQTLGFQRVTNVTTVPSLTSGVATLSASQDFYYSTGSGDVTNVVAGWMANSTATRLHTYYAAQSANNQITSNTLWGIKATYTVSAITAGATSTQITTTAPTTLATGDFVVLSGTNSTPTIDRTYKVTVIDATNFTIPYGTTANGTAGTVTVPFVAIASDRSSADNGFMATDYTQSNALTGAYPAHGFSFAYPPSWYKIADGAPTFTVDATYRAGKVGAFLQGFWNYPSTEAVDSPAMIDEVGQNLGFTIGTITANAVSPGSAFTTLVTTSGNHNLLTGDTIVITGSNSTPSIDGTWTVTVPTDAVTGLPSTKTFTITVPVKVTVAGTAGTVSAVPNVGRVILGGFNPTYRGYQDNTAVLVARAAFLSNCTPPSAP
jgi:hypothetical protein